MARKSFRATVHIDGGARGNPGPAAAGIVIAGEDGVVLRDVGLFLGEATNNVAEYRGLLAGLAGAAELGAGEVDVFSDSELLVRQMTGQYRVRNEALKKLHEEARLLEGRFRQCRYHHIPRRRNVRADRLVNRALNLARNVEGDEP